MNDWYFYQEKGKTVGPLNADDIKGRIKDGRIRIFDLIYKDGEPTWKMALEHSTLRQEFKSTALANLKDRPWVCLQKKSPEGLDFTTTGPFTTDEIRDQLQAGTISYSDYAWKDGLHEWKRIGALEEFNRRARASAVVPPVPVVPQDSSIELLKNVVELRRPRIDGESSAHQTQAGHQKVERRDTTGLSQSLALPPIPHVSDPPAPKSTAPPQPYTPVKMPPSSQPPPPPPAKGVSNVPLTPQTPQPLPFKPAPLKKDDAEFVERRRNKRRFDWSMVAFLTLTLTGVVFIVSRFAVPRQSSPLPEPIAQIAPPPAPSPRPDANTKIETQPPPPPVSDTVSVEPGDTESKPVDQPEPEETKEPPPAVAVPHRNPTVLHVAVQSGAQPRIELRTDASPDVPMYVQIIAPAGQVLEGGSFYRFMKLHPNADAKKPVTLPALKFPGGFYVLRAEIENIHKEAKFKVGISDAGFKPQLNRQRKACAYAVWKERLALFKLAQTLEKQVTAAMVPTKKFSGHGWEPLIDLKRGAGGKYLMFDDWWELHNIAKEAKGGVTVSLAGRVQRERERLAGFSVWK